MRLACSILAITLAGLPGLLFLSSGCHKSMTVAEASVETLPDSSEEEPSAGPDDAASQPAEADVVVEGTQAERTEKGGAQLWSENCMRCHNARPPRERSDRQWEIIVHHMRVRGNLTAQEHRLILAFLKSAN